jgi:hypothetical protein
MATISSAFAHNTTDQTQLSANMTNPTGANTIRSAKENLERAIKAIDCADKEAVCTGVLNEFSTPAN